MKEVWKEIPGYEGYYKVNRMGIIKGIERIVKHPTGSDKTWKARYILQSMSKYGYMSVTLAKEGKNTQWLIHRLVALAFIPNPENKPCVNHLNGIKTDNYVENLDWCTYSENEKHSYRVLGKNPNKTMLGKIPPNAQYVGMFNKDNGSLINTYRTATEAAKHIGGDQGCVSTCCRGEQKYCYGYIYEYISKDLYIKYNNESREVFKLQRSEYVKTNPGFGSNHYNSKLNEDKVILIRNLYPEIKQVELAKRFNVSKSTIIEVINNKIWTHI